MEKRYRALRTIGTIYKVLGAIAGILTIIAIIGVCATSVLGGAAFNTFGRDLGMGDGIGMFSSVLGGVMFSLSAAFTGGLAALTLYSLGEGIYLFLAIEENTRYTAQVLSYQANATSNPAPPASETYR